MMPLERAGAEFYFAGGTEFDFFEDCVAVQVRRRRGGNTWNMAGVRGAMGSGARVLGGMRICLVFCVAPHYIVTRHSVKGKVSWTGGSSTVSVLVRCFRTTVCGSPRAQPGWLSAVPLRLKLLSWTCVALCCLLPARAGGKTVSRTVVHFVLVLTVYLQRQLKQRLRAERETRIALHRLDISDLTGRELRARKWRF